MHQARPEFSVDFQAKVEALQRPETYPDKVREVEAQETHMSWVFLTPEHAYKMKKEVKYPFLDFSTLEKRKADCEREVRLNRRLASGVYKGIVPLASGNSQLELGGSGMPVEWLVKMRRLPRGKMLDAMLERREVTEETIVTVAHMLAQFYRQQKSVALLPAEYLRRLRWNLKTNLEELVNPVYGLDAARVHALHEAQLALLENHQELFACRASQGRIVEGHGDLRPEHICLEDPPVIFDCLEFNRDLRILDPIEDLGYLAMECDRLKAPQVGRIAFDIYAKETADEPPARLIFFHKIYRATLRARLCMLHRKDLHRDHWPEWRQKAREYLELAKTYRTARSD